MIRFRVEWLEAPGVRHRLLARTWARLQIEVDGRVVTEAVDRRSDRVRREVYYSVLPLTQWIVQNWWFLLNEPYRFPRVMDSRDLAQDPSDRLWVQRHSLFTGREGGALPDLTFFRDGDSIVARWFPDRDPTTFSPVQFIGNGETKMTPPAVEEGLANFVETVMARLQGFEDSEAVELREDWAETCEDRKNHRQVCEWSGRLGLDPCDPEELTDELLATLRSTVASLEEPARHDLLDAEEARFLGRDLRWLSDVRRVAADAGPPAGPQPETPAGNGVSAHEAGYQGARTLRKRLHAADRAGPVADIDETLRHLGWARQPRLAAQTKPAGPLTAAVERSEAAGAVVVSPPEIGSDQQRFHASRAIWLRHFGGGSAARRLVTGARTREQQASRAFAAEFLAPAQGLAREVGGMFSATAVGQLAGHYGVSTSVIRHQIENHRIGWLDHP